MTKVLWSWYRPEDKAEADALHLELEKRIALPLESPDLIMRPIIAAVVGRVAGKIEHVLFVEAEAEVQAGSANVLAPKDLAEPMRMLTEALQYYEIRIVRAFVPMRLLKSKKKRAAAIERTLTGVGFTKEKPSLLASFYKWIPQVKKTGAA